ncbi:BTAD domain-containing putative transcriptional regulator [Kutzneria sp. NPDC052558]|uniref:AfsR/SARP family transcriptional regulator n=1 Tax=Kutzneria sp. NPDC052558 TaxID=3364121 RepID=UPI0037CB1BA9
MGVPLQIEILGPVRVRLGDQEPALGPPLQRVVLALLALRVNNVVSRTDLVDALWGDAPPAAAQGSLSTYVSALRRVLEPELGSRAPSSYLVSAGSGYVLRLDEQAIDLHRVEACRESARKALLAGDSDTAAAWCREALALWRGRPLDGIAGPFATTTRTRLEDLQLTVVESLAEALLAGKHHDRVVAELIPVVRQHPLRERPRALLITALHRSGRTAEALAQYEQARQAVVDKLGIEPGPQLRALRAELEGPKTVTERRPLVPAQLPHAMASFTGRTREITELTDRLMPAGPAMAISTIDGVGGVGKTALAVHVAHRVADRYPDGQLYVDLRGFDPGQDPLEPSAALSRLLRGLGVDAAAVPGEVEAQAAYYRSQLAGRRMLVLLDNAASAEQVRPLLPGSPTCSVIVTSRSKLHGLAARDGAYRVPLDVLAPEEAVRLLSDAIGPGRMTGWATVVAEVAELCGRLPLALRIAAAQLVDRPHLDIVDLRDELADERARLDALAVDGEDTAVRAVFASSYCRLRPPVARLFRLLGLHAGAEFSLPAAAALAGIEAPATRRLLTELAGGHLIEEVRADRYRLHDLLKVYAVEQTLEQDEEPVRAEAVGRMLDFYLHTADAMDRALAPFRRRPPLRPPVPGGEPITFAGPAPALAWGETELANLVAATEQAARVGDVVHAAGIPASMWAFLAARLPWTEWLGSHRVGLAAAEAAGNDYGQTSLLIGLGYAYQELSRPEVALSCLEKAKQAHDRIPGRPAADIMDGALGAAYFAVGRVEEALAHTNRALAGYRARKDRWGEGWASCNLGGCARQLGQYEESVRHYEHALGLFEQLSDRVSLLKACRELGRSHLKFGHHDEAVDCFRTAVDLFGQLGGRVGEGWSRHELAEALNGAGRGAEALDQWRQAVRILDEVDDPRAGQVRARLSEQIEQGGVGQRG